MLRRWKKISEEIRFANPWWRYKHDIVELPSSAPGEYHYVDTPGSAMVIPLSGDGGITMVNQYRYLNERESLEFVCGGVKEGWTYEEMARRELEEEAGFRAEFLEHIGSFNPFNGVTNEICRVYIATGLLPVPPRPDDTEEFEIVKLTPGDVVGLIRDGRIWDGMTLAAWALFTERYLQRTPGAKGAEGHAARTV